MANLTPKTQSVVSNHVYDYGYGYGGTRVVKKTTTTKKYNQKGQLIQETVVEETTTYNDSYYPWRTYPSPVWYSSGISGHDDGVRPVTYNT